MSAEGGTQRRNHARKNLDGWKGIIVDSYHTFLPSYSVGTDCYQEIGWVTRKYGRKAVAIGGKTAIAKAKAALLEGIAGSDVEITDFIWYGGNSTLENVDRLRSLKTVQEADMIFAIGGGRALDTGKIAGDIIDKPVFTFPTVASNCAACTCLAVIYHTDGAFREYYYPKEPPKHTFINTKIIAESPEDLLWAGIGDALSKEYEVLFATKGKELFHTTLLGAQLSKACTSPLLALGKKAIADCHSNTASYELEQVALDIIISTGIVSNLMTHQTDYYYNSSLAHAFYYGATVIDRCENHLHGEIVAFGVLCLLTYEGKLAERDRICLFNKSIHLPTCLKDLDLAASDLAKIAEKAATVKEWSCAPEEVSTDQFIQAIIDCSTYGEL